MTSPWTCHTPSPGWACWNWSSCCVETSTHSRWDRAWGLHGRDWHTGWLPPPQHCTAVWSILLCFKSLGIIYGLSFRCVTCHVMNFSLLPQIFIEFCSGGAVDDIIVGEWPSLNLSSNDWNVFVTSWYGLLLNYKRLHVTIITTYIICMYTHTTRAWSRIVRASDSMYIKTDVFSLRFSSWEWLHSSRLESWQHTTSVRWYHKIRWVYALHALSCYPYARATVQLTLVSLLRIRQREDASMTHSSGHPIGQLSWWLILLSLWWSNSLVKIIGWPLKWLYVKQTRTAPMIPRLIAIFPFLVW